MGGYREEQLPHAISPLSRRGGKKEQLAPRAQAGQVKGRSGLLRFEQFRDAMRRVELSDWGGRFRGACGQEIMGIDSSVKLGQVIRLIQSQ